MIMLIIILLVSTMCLILHYIEKYQKSKQHEKNNCKHDFVYIPKKLGENQLYSFVSRTYYRTCQKCGYSESIEIFN